MSAAAGARSSARGVALVLAGLLVSARCSSRPRAPIQAAPDAALAGAGWRQEGIASWYGGDDGFEGKPTASGEIYDSALLTAAHRDLPLGTVVDVESLENGRSVRVRINDRGPFIRGRVIDLSQAAARELLLIGPGTGPVRVTVVQKSLEPAPFSPTGLWAVQIGSFADLGRAQRHAERARATGRTAYLEPYRGLSRVKVGQYESRREAREALVQLEAEGFEGIVVPSN